jgi:hypothetical protein
VSYTFPGAKGRPRQQQHHPLPPVGTYYPLSLADAAPAPLARPSTGIDLRTLILILAAAAVGFWIFQRFFAKKKKMARNERMYFTTEGPLRGLDRLSKRIKTNAQLFAAEGYDGASKDLKEASVMLEEFTQRTREQTLED